MAYLYVTQQGATVCYESNRVRVKYENEILQEVLAETLESMQIYGNIQITTQCLHRCLAKGIDVVMYTYYGRYCGRLVSPYHVQVARQRKQAVLTDEFKLQMSRNIIRAKIKNQIVLLRRYMKTESCTFNTEIKSMLALAHSVSKADNLNEIEGYEGAAARSYFSVLGKLIDPAFTFDKRSKNPPKDPFNSMIGLGYSRLYAEIHGKLEAKGLNPYFGMLHQDKEHHVALASDLIEEWRPIIVDSTVMSMLNGHELSTEDFVRNEDGSVYMERDGYKKYMMKLEQKLAQEHQYLPYVDYPVSFRRAIDMQINTLCHAIEDYNPSAYVPIRIR